MFSKNQAEILRRASEADKGEVLLSWNQLPDAKILERLGFGRAKEFPSQLTVSFRVNYAGRAACLEHPT